MQTQFVLIIHGNNGSWDDHHNLMSNGSVQSAIGKFEFIPIANATSGIYIFTGVLNGSTGGTTTQIDHETAQISLITTLQMGKAYPNSTNVPLMILQYL